MTDTMRILAVTNMYPTADAPARGTFVGQQVESLRRAGIDVDLIFADRARDGRGVYRKLARQLREQIEQTKPALVHAMYGGLTAEIVTRFVRGVPVVVSFCGSDLLGEKLSRVDKRFSAWLGVRASRAAARRADGVVVKSANLRAALPGDLPPRKIKIIPNGVDLERFRPLDRAECRARLGWDAGTFHVLFPANSGNAVKRPRLARSAIDALRERGVRAELHHLSGVPHALVPVWLNASDALLLTSRHEGSANVLKEALACDVPVVSVDVGDARERLAGVGGCHIVGPDASDLARKLALVREGPRRVDGRAAVASLSLEAVALRLLEFYEEVLSARAARSEVAPPAPARSKAAVVSTST